MIARLRALWRRLREILMARDQFDVDSAFEDSRPRGSLSQFMDSRPPQVPAETDPTAPGALDTQPSELVK